jgi:hypothetical protein
VTLTARRLTAILGACAALTFAAPAAHAGPLVASGANCTDPPLENPFLPWLDPADYVLAPDGTLEDGGAGWALAGAAVVSGNEPYYVHGAGESRSLEIAAGGSATTPVMCVGIEHPTLRFFARRSGGSLLSSLRVEVLFEDAGGSVRRLTIGIVGSTGTWQPTPVMPVTANLLALLPDGTTPVQFRFVPQGPAAEWTIDDVYVDPRRLS